MLKNPFTPTFGSVPPIMAGRKKVVADMRQAFINGPGDPNLATIITGARGTGKTALLALLSQEAESIGWVSANVSALPGMLDDILIRARRASAHLIEQDNDVRLKGLNVGQLLGVEFEYTAGLSNWRSNMEDVITKLEEINCGLLITIDEVDPSLDEMIEMAAVFQHFVREGRKVALVMAGLPSHISALASSQNASFIRRARLRSLDPIPDREIAEAFRKTVVEAGRTIEMPALKTATKVISGFPYMMQLVGYEAWAQDSNDPEVTLKAVENAAELARLEMEEHVFAATVRELSKKDIEFLLAMAQNDEESRLSDIAKRMGVKSNYASQYKRRLEAAGIVSDRSRGVVGMDIPGFQEYLFRRFGGKKSD